MIICVNWKMNLKLSEALELCKELQHYKNLIVAPPMPFLSLLISNYPQIKFAAQNVSHIEQDEGAYTGEISSYILSSINIKYAIIGHYERRKYFGENDELIILKAKNCFKYNITPIICFGEEQIGQDPITYLEELTSNLSQKAYYAYEPYWAIGNKNVNLQLARDNLEKVIKYFGQDTQTKIFYGGSVNSENIKGFKNIAGLDGLLVGSASLKINELTKIIEV
jgi:triosephosphate isomerase (TIM)